MTAVAIGAVVAALVAVVAGARLLAYVASGQAATDQRLEEVTRR